MHYSGMFSAQNQLVSRTTPPAGFKDVCWGG